MTNALYWHAPEPAAAPPPGDKLRLDRPMPPALENGMTDETSAGEVARVVEEGTTKFLDMVLYDHGELATHGQNVRIPALVAFLAMQGFRDRALTTLSAEVERLRAEVEEARDEHAAMAACVSAAAKARDAAEARADGLAAALDQAAEMLDMSGDDAACREARASLAQHTPEPTHDR